MRYDTKHLIVKNILFTHTHTQSNANTPFSNANTPVFYGDPLAPLVLLGVDGRHEPLCDKTILYLVQLGLAALREGQELPASRSLALDMLAQIWANFPDRLSQLQLHTYTAGGSSTGDGAEEVRNYSSYYKTTLHLGAGSVVNE